MKIIIILKDTLFGSRSRKLLTGMLISELNLDTGGVKDVLPLRYIEARGDSDPASAIAALYHERWTIETFYGEFKTVMKANKWHCQTVENFEKELACQMIVTCLTKFAMSEAASSKSTTPGKISFSKAYTEVGCLFKMALPHAGLLKKRKWADRPKIKKKVEEKALPEVHAPVKGDTVLLD